MNPLDSAETLRAWLNQTGVDLSKWGTGDAKTVIHLWDELRDGDCSIQTDPPLRKVDVIQVIIRQGDQVLLELAQEMSDGRQRARNHPPSEKMKPTESPLDAARRCLREELGLDDRAVHHLESIGQQVHQLETSPSYPGLPTQYTLHSVEAAIVALPSAPFWRMNNAFSLKGDPVQRHLWGWRPTSELGTTST